MGNTIVKLYQKQNFVIGEDILKAIKRNNLTLDEALLIIYFCSSKSPMLDIEDIKDKFDIEEMHIISAFAKLSEKNLISINMKKNRSGIVEEIIDLTPLYESIIIENSENDKSNITNSIFSTFENEFGRPLSSMEYEIINKWLDKGISDDLINNALKEAIFNGSLTLRYIDAILMEWVKKGFKTGKDVDIYLKSKKTVKKKEPEALFDYNWLDDDE